MSNFVSYSLSGLTNGCSFAIMAVGIVLAYRATGVFNFAFAAQAYLAAIVYSEMLLHANSVAVSAIVSIGIVSPLLGLFFDVALFSRIPRGDATAKVIVSLALFVGLPAVINLFVPVAPFAGQPLLGDPTSVVATFFGAQFNGLQIGTMAVTVLAVLIVGAVFRFTRLGVEMRASVESVRLLELVGVSARRVTSLAWMFSSMLAGLAGVLVAPNLVTVTPDKFAIVFISGVAGAIIGGFRHFWLAFAGGLVLGMAEYLAIGFIPATSIFQTLVQPSIPFVVMAAFIVFHPGVRRLGVADDPLAGVDPPVRSRSTTAAITGPGRLVDWLAWAICAACALGVLIDLDPVNLQTISAGVSLAIILLSITLLTGIGGNLSLAQASFAGLGALACGQLMTHDHVSFFLAAICSSAVAGAIGLALAVPAIRLRGLALMLLTFAFALLCDQVLFQTALLGSGGTVTISAPTLGPVHFDTESGRQLFVLSVCVFGIAAIGVHFLRIGTTGLFIAAVRDAELGAASLGIDRGRIKLTLFALASVLAGVGGACYGAVQNEFSAIFFSYNYSLLFLIALFAIGTRRVGAALVAGILLAFIETPVQTASPWSNWTIWAQVALAVGAVSYAWSGLGLLERAREGLVRVATFVIGRFAQPRPNSLAALRGNDEKVAP